MNAAESAPEPIGRRIRQQRESLGVTQAALAELTGLSQSTISRIEGGQQRDPGLSELGSIAKALRWTIRDLVDGTEVEEKLKRANMASDNFVAFCSNPFCRDNRFDRKADGTNLVLWASSRTYSIDAFENINYCKFCGEKVVKACPACKRPTSSSGQRFCDFCGEAVNTRPTEEEKERMRKILDARDTPDAAEVKDDFEDEPDEPSF